MARAGPVARPAFRCTCRRVAGRSRYCDTCYVQALGRAVRGLGTAPWGVQPRVQVRTVSAETSSPMHRRECGNCHSVSPERVRTCFCLLRTDSADLYQVRHSKSGAHRALTAIWGQAVIQEPPTFGCPQHPCNEMPLRSLEFALLLGCPL